MQDVIIVIHLMIVIVLIGVILIQRSQGGGLGIGGSNNFLTSRGSANFLTRITAILAVSFFSTSLLLAVLSSGGDEGLPSLPGGLPTLPDLPADTGLPPPAGSPFVPAPSGGE